MAAWLFAMLLLGTFAGGILVMVTADVCTQYSMMNVETILFIPVVVFFGSIIAPILGIGLGATAGPAALVSLLPLIFCVMVQIVSGVVFWRHARAGERGSLAASFFTAASAVWAGMASFAFCLSLSA